MAGEYLTPRQIREMSGTPLTVSDFISPMEPCQNPKTYIPFPIIPRDLMDAELADMAEEIFKKCSQIVGDAYESFQSKKDDPEFEKLAIQFQSITGVNPWDIMMEARSRLKRDFED